MNARLDDQFDDTDMSILSMWMDRVGRRALKPANLAWSVGGILAVGFVFSNALFFQQGDHPAAMFSTRDAVPEHRLRTDEMTANPVRTPSENGNISTSDKPVTRIVFDTDSSSVDVEPLPPKVAARPQIEVPQQEIATVAEPDQGSELRELQGLLAELGFYKGTVDGLDGPKTQEAIEAYKANVGLRGIQLTPAELALSAKNNLIVTAAIPVKRPQVAEPVPTREVETVSYTPPKPGAAKPSADNAIKNDVLKVQAGLRAFGNDTIGVDGAMGPQTVAAIKEFQTLFKLPITGAIDKALIQKMTDVGLIN